MVNPLTGIAGDLRAGSDGPLQDERGFVRELWYPEVEDESELSEDEIRDRESRPRTRLELLYFPPVNRHTHYQATLLTRPRLAIGLVLGSLPYGEWPYFYELESEGMDGVRPPLETLKLFVDRSVRVILPPDARPVPRHGQDFYLIEFPEEANPFYQRPERLMLQIYRLQLPGTVPQTPLEGFTQAVAPRTWRPPTGRVSVTPTSGPVQTAQVSRTTILRSAGRRGGASFHFCRDTETVDGSIMGASAHRHPLRVMARLDVAYWNTHLPGAYHFDVNYGPDGTTEAQLTFDRNVRVALYADGIWIDTAERLGDAVLEERLALLQSDWGITLRIKQERDGWRVRRPTVRLRSHDGTIWYEAAGLELLSDVGQLPNQARADAIANLTLVLGFVPVIGDILDVGEFIYMVITGEDFSGAAADEWDLIFSALALLPFVPSAVQRMERVAEARRTADRAGVSWADIERRLARANPDLTRALREATDFADFFRRRRVDVLAEQAVFFAGIRDDKVYALLRGWP